MSILEQITFSLPAINGDIATGIAQGTEAQLESEEKLAVVSILAVIPATPDKAASIQYHSKEDTIKLTLALLLDKCIKAKTSDDHTAFLLQSANVALSLGLICTHQGKPDGDWTIEREDAVKPEMVTEERGNLITDALKACSVTRAATIIAATKVNWWKENHHTGQGPNSGRYITKAFIALTEKATSFPAQWKTVVHRAGHWCSTRVILAALGKPDIIQVTPLFATKHKIVATDDVRLRLESAPAGTGRLSILYAICKSFLLSPVFYMCPNPDDYMGIKSQYLAMMETSSAHHVGGAYLTGRKAAYCDTDYSSKLGRAVTWMKAFIPHSTIKDSPHAKNAEMYEDYDAEFSSAIEAFKRTAKDRNKEILKILNAGGKVNVDGPNAVLRAWGLTPNASINEAVAKKATDDANKKSGEKSTEQASK